MLNPLTCTLYFWGSTAVMITASKPNLRLNLYSHSIGIK